MEKGSEVEKVEKQREGRGLEGEKGVKRRQVTQVAATVPAANPGQPTSLAGRPGACKRDCQFFNRDPALAKYSTATFV